MSSITKKKIQSGEFSNAISQPQEDINEIEKNWESLGLKHFNKNKIGHRLHDVPVIGPIESLSRSNIDFDEIYICLPSADRKQMLKIRVIPCLDVKEGRVVKGINFIVL